MASTTPHLKRKAISERPISPPPTKKSKESLKVRVQSDFFVKTSEKSPPPTTWSERSANDDVLNTLLVGRYNPKGYVKRPGEMTCKKFAVFDMDGTLITTRGTNKFAKDAQDWKWWNTKVPDTLRTLHEDEGYQVIIVSNQGGISLSPNSKKPGGRTRVKSFKQKCENILYQLNIPTTIYAATEIDNFRKPRTGIWEEVCDDYEVSRDVVDMEKSFFVGDAAGRVKTDGIDAGPDFSSSDRDFAHNIGLKFYTPESYFLGKDPREHFRRDFKLEDYPFDDSQ